MPEVRILGYSFPLPDKYLQGHVLTDSEAYALNNLRKENIRNNITRKLQRFIAQNGEGRLDDEQQLIFAQVLLDYAEAYSFPLRITAAPMGNDAFEQHLQAVIEEYMARSPTLWSGVDPALIERLKLDADLRAEAERRVDDAKKLAFLALL